MVQDHVGTNHDHSQDYSKAGLQHKFRQTAEQHAGRLPPREIRDILEERFGVVIKKKEFQQMKSFVRQKTMQKDKQKFGLDKDLVDTKQDLLQFVEEEDFWTNIVSTRDELRQQLGDTEASLEVLEQEFPNEMEKLCNTAFVVGYKLGEAEGGDGLEIEVDDVVIVIMSYEQARCNVAGSDDLACDWVHVVGRLGCKGSSCLFPIGTVTCSTRSFTKAIHSTSQVSLTCKGICIWSV